MCCARLTGLPTGGLGCPLVADLILVDGAKAGVLYSNVDLCMHWLMVSKPRFVYLHSMCVITFLMY